MKKLQGWAAAAASTTTPSVGDFCFKSICVFCESSSGNGTVYQAARELGTELVSTHTLWSFIQLNTAVVAKLLVPHSDMRALVLFACFFCVFGFFL